MMKKELDMTARYTPLYETIRNNFGGTYYRGVNQTDALITAQQSGFECTVLRDGSLFAFYSPISGMKYYTMDEVN